MKTFALGDLRPLVQRRFRVLLLLPLLGWVNGAGANAAESAKPVLLYSRYFNAQGESRYLPDGSYAHILRHLGSTFDVQTHGKPPTPETLRGAKVVLIANPSDTAVGTNPPPPHFSRDHIRVLRQFVQDGGGLVILGNQENHNLEVEDTNVLLFHFGLQFTNVYTDAKALRLSPRVPIIGGLTWAYYTGNQVRLIGDHPSHPRAVVENDLSQKPPNGTRDAEGTLLAVSEPGRGRVVVATDAGWLTDDALSGRGIGNVSIREHDNAEICLRLMRWAARLQ